MPIFELNGKKYNVQDQHIADFASEYPDATTIEEREGKKYRVKSSDYQSFQSEIGATQPEVQTPYALGAAPVEKPKKKGLPEQDYIYEDELQKDRQGFEKEQYQGLSWKDKAILRVMGKNARQMGVNADPAREILTLDKQKGVGLNDLEERKNVMQAQRNQVSTMRDEIDQILIDTQDEDQFAGIPMAGPMGATMSGMRASTRQNDERRDYMAAKRSLTDAANIIEEADRHAADGTYGGWYETSFAGGAARGFGDKLFDARTWSFGVADKVDNDRLNQALEDFDNGKELTKSQQALLDAKAVEMATQAYFGSYLGRGYKAGQVTAEAIPFMFEFIINPATAVGKSAGSMMARYALKRFGKGAATKALSRGARVAGDIAGAATMSATTGLGRVAADAAERMAGDIHYDIDQDNQTVFAGHTKGEDPATAYRKAFGATTIENYSEMFGNYFSPILGGSGKMLRKGAESLGAGKVVKMLDDVAASDLAKVVSDFEKNAQWSGTLSEYAEEVAGGIMNAIFVGDQTLDTDEQTGVFNLDNNINTLLGVALLGGAMSTIKTAGYPIHKYQADKRIVMAETDAVSAFGNAEKWAEVKSQLNLEDAVERGKALRDVLADKNLTEEQKVVAFKYVEALQNRDGVRIGEMKHYTDETVPQEQKEIEQSFDNGYTLTTPEEKQDANSNLAYWVDKLRVDFQMNEDADPEDLFEGYENPLDALNSEQFANEEHYKDALQYIYAKATMDGAVQNVRDQIDARIAENNARIDGVKNETDNTLMPATLKQDDRQVFIVRGNIAQLDDGSIDGEKSDGHIFIVDAQTLKPEMIAPSAILSLGAIENADTAKETQATQIAELMATEASAQMDGTLGFVQGDTYNILGEDGIQHTAQVVADNGDGSVQIVVDGAQEATTLPKDQVQAMSDAYHKARAIAYNEQKKAQEVVEQEAQVAEEAPQSALEQIPTNENGEQVFEEAPAETTWAALIEMNEGDVAEAADTAQQMLEVSQKELEKAMNEKAGVGTSVAEIQKIKAERKAKIDALQNRVNYWTNVLSQNTPMQEVEQTEEVAEPIEEVAEEPMVKEVEETPIVEEEIAPIIEEAQVAEPIVEAEEVVEPIVEQSRPKVKNISKKEDARRQPLRERVAEWVDKLGVPVVVMETFSDIENADAKREIRKGGRIAGWYEPSTGAVMLYMPHLTDMSEIDKTITHEIVAHKGLAHMLGKNKHNALLDRVWDMMSEEAKAKYINYPNVNGNTRRAADEYIAFLSEGVNLTELDQSVWDKIIGFVRELLAEVGINLQLTDADIADLIRLSYTNLVRENQKAKETKGADDINEQEGQALFSIRTYEESGRENLQKFLKGQVKKKRITKADAEAIEATMEQMYETAVEYKDKFAPFGAWSEAEVVKGKDGQPVFSVVKKNGEYTMNLDFSTVCKKRRTLDAVFSEMIDRGLIDMIPMEGEQIAEINNIIRDYGFETACALCFVDAKRFRVAQVADKFCDMWNPMTKMSEEELQGVIKEYGEDAVRGKIAKRLIAHPEDRIELNRDNFIDSKGFEQMEINHPEILSLYKQAQGTSLAKIPFGDVQYLNELEDKSQWTPKRAYAVGGVRLQSFSDYVPRMFFDYMQMTAGLASKKLPVHAYTKEPIFAKQFGLTGMKINLSLVPKVVEGGVAAGLDADGNYAWMEGETFPFEEAMVLQNAEGYRENCGTIAVGVSDEHIEKMLDDPNIRMIIPYHKSGLNPLVAKKNRIAEFTDYTNVQNTRSANGTKLEKEDLKDMPDFNSLMHDEGMDARQAAQAYLDWCDSKGFIPKFNKFRGHQNYYKLLEDFTTIVPNAEGVETTYPQREVTMTFPTEDSAFGSIESLIREGLEEDAILEGKREEKLGEIVDTIEKEMVRFRFIGQQGAANLDKAEEATTRLDDLAVARDMWVEGKDAKTIKAATGWEHGADGKWRYEVMDIKVESPEKWVNKRGALKLPTIIGENDNLFVEYPDLRDVKVKKTAGAGGGFYSPKDNTISVAVGTLKKAIEILADPARFGQTEESFRPIYDGVISKVEGTLTHEIQHFIQHKEWFAKGGNPEMLNPSYDKDLVENQYAHMVDAMNRKIREYNALSPIERRTYNAITLRNSIMSDQRKIKKYAKSVRLGDEGYRRLAGEVEARNADRRRNMPMGERLASLASETEDVARKDQIFIFNALADENQNAQFRVVEPAPIFYSNAANAVLGIKQDKATPEQWLKMIEKNGGLKSGEDKWLGLSDWLKASDKKTLTKQEVLDYINENQIQIEDVEYRDRELMKLEIEGSQQFINLQDEYMGIFEDYMENPEADMSEYEAEQYARDAMVEQFGNYFNVAFATFGKELYVDDAEFAAKLLGLPYAKELNQTRLDYTTQGLTDKREIALTIPTIESWNEADDIHFGDAGDGRAIAWIRFGETVDEYGFRVLVIDEIQSKRHQEGREKGYRPSDVDKYLKDNNVEVVETGEFYEFYRDGELDRRFSKGLLHYKVDEAKKLYVAGYNKSDIPEAPFEKNWAELAMKRMLRYAAENGYDAIAWTKGDQQAERYDLSKSVERIDAEDNNVEEASDGTPIAKNITIRTSNWPIHLYVDANGVIRGGQYANHQLSEVVGKGIAEKLMQKGDVSLSGDGLRIGGEGMKGFYDEMLPRFMNKYGKKWGVKVQDVTLPFIEEAGRTMHSVDVTDSMRESVMQGQPMFRVVDSKKPFEELEERYKRLDKSNTEALNAWRDEKAATIQSVITAISDELGFEPPIMVFNGGKDIQEVVDHIVDAYKEMANLDVDKEWVKTYIEESKAIGLYWPDAGVITSDVSNYDNTNDVLQASSMLMHENTHHLVNSQFDNQDLEAIWDEAVNASHPLVNHIEKKYKNIANGEKGNEVLAYAIGNIAKNTRENLFNYVKGEPVSEENLLEKAEYSLPLGKFALSEILNTYKNDLRRSKEEVGGSNREANRGDHRVGRLLRDRTGIRRKAVKEAAELFAKQLNTPIRIVEDVNTITDNNAKLQERKRNAKGWFDNKANEVVVVLPNATSVEDVRETIFHEVVGHKGLRELVGKERYDAFLEKVYRGASETIRERIARRAAKLGWNFNLATDEYLADLAEEGFEDRENRNFFEVVRDLFLDMLSEAKIALGYNISDNDMRYMLWRTYQMQRSKGAMGIAEDMVMQQKLGVGNFAPNDTQFRVAENGSLAKRVSDIMEEYDDSEEIFTIEDVADRIEELINEYDGNDSTTTLENILNDYRDAQSEANRYGHRWDAGGEDAFEEALRLYAAQPTQFRVDDDVRFRAVSPSDISTKGIKQGIRNEYDKLVKTSAYQSREASQDSMLSLRRFMEMTAKAYEIPMDAIKDWENAYQSENALSSKNEAQIEEFDRLYGAPLIQTVQELRKKGYTYEQIDDYLQIKHGIERNREMAVRAAISDEEGKMDKEKLEKWNAAKERVSNDQSLDSWEKMQRALDKSAEDIIYSAYLDKIFREAGEKEREAIESLANKKYKGDINRATEEFFDTFRSEGFRNFAAPVYRDYSGLTAMYPKKKKIEDAVEKGYAEVNDFEKNVGQNLINELWRRIRAANMQTLNKTYRTGLISKETFDSISNMYSYYVPLRGFAETTSDEVYGYLNNEPMAFNAPIRKARGRSSKADQVLPNVLSAAHSAILQGNRNTMKNHFLNFVQHYPTDLISVQNMWVEYDKAKKQWVAKFPELEDTDSPEEVATKTQAFEEKMKELKEKYPKQYKQVTQKIDVPYVVQKQHLKQHQIVVKRNGLDVVLTVNGSPRLAIVMNGTQPTTTLLGKVKDWASARTRYLSGMYTSYNPDFVVSNYMRDAIYTNSTVWLKESPAYAARFNKNNVTTCNPVNMGRLILKYSAGTLDMNNEVEKAFYDFVMNGGETGYAKLASIEQLKKDIGHMIEPTMFDNVKALGKKLAFINRSAESSARFAAFLTSRQMGRSVARSVADAKEISVNFNKKGAGDLFMGAKDQTWIGKIVAGSMGWTMPMYAFFNAGMQGLNNFLRIYKHAPLKTTALTSGLFLLGTLIASMLEGDDEEEYYALPESVRRQNIVFRAGDNAWVKIPLPIEMRAVYGLGEMFTSIAKGKEDLSDHGIAYKMAEQISQVLPINILEGKGGLGTLVPTVAAPIIEVMDNEDWAGLPIYREDIYKGDKDIPEYLRVYARTGEGYVAASEFLNDITGGDNRERGALGFVNPAVIEHLVDGYLGGPAQFMNKVVSSAEMAFGDKEFDLRAVPFVNRVLMSDNTTMSKKTVNNYYYRHKEEAERIDRLVKNYQKDMNDPKKTDEERAYAAEKAQEKRDSEEWRKAQEFLRRTSAVEDIEKQFKEAPEGTSDEVVYKVKDFANEVYKKAEK